LAVVLVIAALLTLILFLAPASDIHRLPWARALSPDSPLYLDQGNLGAALSRYPLLALDCYYPGCGPCKAMNQTVEELSAELRGQVVFGLINARSNQNFTNQYRASNYPTLFLFKDGNLSARLVGNRSKTEVLAELRKLKPDLDESGIKGATAPPPITAPEEISLAGLGVNSPDKPMPVKDADLQMALDKYPLLVLDAYVSWCEPCHRMNQTVSTLARELQGQVAFGVLDVEENNATKAKFNITSYPTFLIFDNGKPVSTLIGTRSSASLLQELKRLHPSLDTSRVKLTPVPAAMPAATTGEPQAGTSPPAAELPLARLGVNNPDRPMTVSDDDLQSALDKYPFFVLDAYASWCEPCHRMNQTVSALARELQGQVAFGLMDIGKNPETKHKYNITSYPTLLIFRNGKLVSTSKGDRSDAVLLSELKRINPGLDTSKVKLSQPAAQTPKPKQSPAQVCANMTKSDDAVLEAFIVSRCPFGLQMQRIMADIIGRVPEAKNSLKVMYIGSISNGTITSMHGEEEAQENLKQICIREEQPGKYWDYVGCYMKEGKSLDCLASVDQSRLGSCTKDPGRGLAYAQKDFDLAGGFRITGSPTLLMNGKIVKESDFATNTTNSRSPEALKELLCCGFNKQPSFCSLQLNTTRAATMFSVKAQPTAPTRQVPGAASTAQAQPAQITLARLGEKNPHQPMPVTDKTLSSAINQYPLLVLEGYASWCGYSHMMNATLAELAGELQGQVAFGLIDAEKNTQTKTEYNISAYPTTLIFKDGKLIDTVVGNQQKSSFVAKLKKIDPALDTSKVKIAPPPVQVPPRPKLSPSQVCANMTKSDDAVLQAFIVSRCPFGLQMQRIMANMINNVPEAEDSLNVMYIGSVSNGTITSMHGDKEAQENLRQICIRVEQPDKYWSYVGCYMEEGKSEECLASVDMGKLNSCLKDPSRCLAYAQKDFDLADSLQITGSPTLVMNGKIVKESDFATNTVNSRSPEALKDLLCCGFKSHPGFCSRDLNGTRAVTMFSAD